MTRHIFEFLEKEMLKFRDDFGARERLKPIYLAAILFFKRSIWHDASELPNEGESILVRYNSSIHTGKFISLHISANHYVYNLKTEPNKEIAVFTRKWASAEDILPEDKEDEL